MKILNLTGKTFYCQYCGDKVPPGKEHECDGKYEEDRDVEEEGD